MKNKKIMTSLTSLMAVTLLAGCNPKDTRTRIQFWTGFGTAVNETLTDLIARFEEQNTDIRIDYESKGGYPALQQAISGSISTSNYPHIANGYPDHFAGYANANVLLNLDSNSYINHPEYGVNVNEFYSDFMKENTDLVANATLGLPFNKSTEVMIVNQSFFDVAMDKDPSIIIPQTWQDLKVVGPKLKQVIVDNKWIGKLVKKDGTTVDKPSKFDAEIAGDIAFDLTYITKIDDFIPFSYDSESNFFITILRQWGGQYTQRGTTLAKGEVLFKKDSDSYNKLVDALTLVKELYDDKIIGLPSTFNEGLYSSKPFKQMRLVMTISSSAGVTQNLPADVTDYPFELSVKPVPFNAEKPEAKFVISQGTNLALFRKGNGNDPQAQKERLAAWKFLRYLTYEVNHEFSRRTSYFPVTDGSLLTVDETDSRYLDYKMYSEFLAGTNVTNETVAAKITRDTAVTQASVYQDTEIGWKKFVDPGFLGSSTIRTEVGFCMSKVFQDQTAGLTAREKAVKAIASTLEQLKDYI